MEILLAIAAVVIVGALIYFNRGSKGLDVNNDGKVDLADAKAAVKNAADGVKAAADLNKDGKVTVKDAKVAGTKAKTVVKKAATKAKETVKKTSGRKPRARQ
jgi:biopolymer transport protein ExbD